MSTNNLINSAIITSYKKVLLVFVGDIRSSVKTHFSLRDEQ